MNIKTVFLDNQDNESVYISINHSENYESYMQEKHSEIEITEYIPHLLTKYHNHVVIDFAYSYMMIIFYLPSSISQFQKDYIKNNRKLFERYDIYFEEKQEDPKTIEDLLNYLENLPIRKTNKEKIIEYCNPK